MKMNTFILRALDWPCSMVDLLRDWLEAGSVPAKLHPLSRRCYLMSEAHLSGHRLIIGFETLEDLDRAHKFLAHEVPTHPTTEPTSANPAAEPASAKETP